jgi:Flp pilus assembly protein TadG
MMDTGKTMRLRFTRATSGATAVEVALVLPVLMMLALGMADFSLWIWNKMRVANAARAGAEAAAVYGYDTAKISSAITSATGMAGVSATPAATEWCGCPSASFGVVTATCGSTCASLQKAGTYVRANAQASYSLVFPWPGITSPVALNASAIVRIK